MFGSDTVSSSVPCIVGSGWPHVSLVVGARRGREFSDDVKRVPHHLPRIANPASELGAHAGLF